MEQLLAINLEDFEMDAAPQGDAGSALLTAQARLKAVHGAAIVHGKSAIIVVEGWSSGGRRAFLSQLAGSLDPCWVKMWRSDAVGGDHFLRRFWQNLPGLGEIAVFSGSWYDHVLEPGEKHERALDEINEFEALLRDHGVLLVKLFLHLSEAAHRQQMMDAIGDPWARLDRRDLNEIKDRDAWTKSAHQIFAATDTRWAPWTVINANDVTAGAVDALTAIADQLERNVPMTPSELDLAIVEEARVILNGAWPDASDDAAPEPRHSDG